MTPNGITETSCLEIIHTLSHTCILAKFYRSNEIRIIGSCIVSNDMEESNGISVNVTVLKVVLNECDVTITYCGSRMG